MFLFGSTLVFVIVLTIVLALAVAFAVVFICIKKGILSKGGAVSEAPAKVRNPIVAVLKDNNAAFSGLYEPLYCCSKCKKYAKQSAVFAAWASVAEEIGKDNIAFSNAYNKAFGGFEKWKKKKFMKKAKKLLKLVKKAGILRDKSKSVSFNDATLSRYDFAGSAELTEGELLEILAPFWYKDNVILQKGIVR